MTNVIFLAPDTTEVINMPYIVFLRSRLSFSMGRGPLICCFIDTAISQAEILVLLIYFITSAERFEQDRNAGLCLNGLF